MAKDDFIQIDDPKNELQWVNVDYQIDEYLHMVDKVPILLMNISLKDGYPSFKKVVFKFRPKYWGRVLLSTDQNEWFETLLLEYVDLSYGIVPVFARLQLLEDNFKDKLPELDIEVVRK